MGSFFFAVPLVVYAALGLAAIAEVYAIKYNMEHPIGSSTGFGLNDSGIGSNVNFSKKENNQSNVGNSLKQNAQSPSAAAGSPAPNDNDNNDDDENDDDFDNDDYEHTQRIGRSNGKTPRNNQVQNQQVKNISKKYKLTKDEQEQLHDEITHQGYDYSEVEKIAQEIVKERGL